MSIIEGDSDGNLRLTSRLRHDIGVDLELARIQRELSATEIFRRAIAIYAFTAQTEVEASRLVMQRADGSLYDLPPRPKFLRGFSTSERTMQLSVLVNQESAGALGNLAMLEGISEESVVNRALFFFNIIDTAFVKGSSMHIERPDGTYEPPLTSR
jgi:hypothetical protein